MNKIITLSVTFFCLGLIAFGYGLHETDLGYNMSRGSIDIAIDRTIRTAMQVYQRGLTLLIFSEMFLLLGFLLLLGSKDN